ncbi:MAG: penicillin-binding protein activator LpoB [Bacteroidetes bacterium]|nr:MAG: penicillin-binding protein activator LpoB [Bacteroidota bacterium]
MNKIRIIGILVLIIVLAGCQRKVTRLDTTTTVDLSGRWNDSDSRLVAREMVDDVLSRPWLTRFETRSDRQPVLIVADVRNRTHEHIDSETFMRNMERELLNSGAIRLVQGREFRESVREERGDQQAFASPETIAQWQRELGADYMITGTINSIVDQQGRQKVVFYQVNLELTDMETNEKVWIGEKQIRKLVTN